MEHFLEKAGRIRAMLPIAFLLTLSGLIASARILNADESGQIVHKACSREEMLETLKGRYNYASSDCAARILATNHGCHSSSAILQSHKDSYLLNLCSFPNKHVILELCQDIRLDTIVLANFEYFSSMVKDFSLSVSKRYPPLPETTGWRVVGEFQAENSRREQIFQVAMTGYARYLRVDFHTHHGNEYYCLLSILKVYGKTMMEDFEESKGLPEAKESKNLPGAKETSSGGMVRERDAVSKTTLKATVVSSTPFIIEPPLPPGRDSDASDDKTAPLTLEFESAVKDLINFFKHPSSLCPPPPLSIVTDISLDSDRENNLGNNAHLDNASNTVLSPPPVIVDDELDSSDNGPVSGQENIFKAIYDRLQLLERNVTRSARHLENELRRLTVDFSTIKDEMGLIDEVGGSGGASRSSFRAKLLHHLERKNRDLLRLMISQVEASLAVSYSNDRFLFWIGIFCALQITGLVLVVSLGRCLGWFLSRGTASSPQPVRLLHRKSHSYGEVLTKRSTASTVTSSDEQLVPESSSSPAKSDLIATASRPLLLDESEAELIDATFVPSPLSSRGCVTPSVPEEDHSVMAPEPSSPPKSDDGHNSRDGALIENANQDK